MPFYGPSDVPRSKRLLLISYHFPPGQATGALRWQKLAVFAAEHGWGVDVVTLDPADIGRSDASRLEELPVGTRIFGARQRMPRVEMLLDSAASARRLVRPRRRPASNHDTNGRASNAGDVDTQLVYPWQLNGSRLTWGGLLRAFNAWRSVTRDDPWGAEAAAVAGAVVDPGVHRVIISCGPPHAAHGAASRVARRTGLPLVMDLRDPWGLAQAVDRSRASPHFFALRSRREAECVKHAALVVVNSETHQTALRAVHRTAADRIICVLNGYDEAITAVAPRDRRFTIAYAGSIYLDRDPRSVFAAVARVVRKHGLTPAQFGMDLIGDVERFGGHPTADLAVQAGLHGFVHLHGRRPRAAVLEFLSRATMLLSLPQDLDLSVPSKLYEYFQFEAWLLALARPASGTGVLLRGTGADVVMPDDVDEIARAIDRRYCEFADGRRPPRLMDLNPHLSRAHQAQRLFAALEGLAQGASARPLSS